MSFNMNHLGRFSLSHSPIPPFVRSSASTFASFPVLHHHYMALPSVTFQIHFDKITVKYRSSNISVRACVCFVVWLFCSSFMASLLFRVRFSSFFFFSFCVCVFVWRWHKQYNPRIMFDIKRKASNMDVRVCMSTNIKMSPKKCYITAHNNIRTTHPRAHLLRSFATHGFICQNRTHTQRDMDTKRE